MADEYTSKDIQDLIPPENEQRDSLTWLKDYWRTRNDYIRVTKQSHEGLNEIPFPAATQYIAKVIHLGFFTAMQNEKVARYLEAPTFQVVINDPTDDAVVKKSTQIEKFLNTVSYEMERKGEGDVWNRVIMDAHLYDMGVYKMQLAAQTGWRELAEDESRTGKDRKYPKGSDARENYKMERGVPLYRTYTPLDFFLPQWDGSELEFSWELEPRLLSSCIENQLFDREVMREYEDRANSQSLTMPLIHYCNENYYCTYALEPSLFDPQNPPSWESINFSDMRYLYGYRHGLGRSIYNTISGRHGGWKTSTNSIEGVNKIVLGLNQAADTIASQMLTNIRAKYWPTMNWAVDPELRGVQPGGKTPEPPQIPEGGTIVTFKGETLLPVFQPQNDTTVPWMMDLIKDQMGKLGGSNVLYGQGQPGVDTGYHNAQQISQAEHLDEKQEQHIVAGAIQDGTMIMLYCRELGETFYSHYLEPKKKSASRRNGEYIKLDPDDLYPLPRLDARVRKPSPIDFISAVRAARELSDDRQGKGALMADLNIRGEVLSRESPDEEELLVRIQEQKNKLWNNGVIDEKIAMAMNLKLVSNGVPQVGPGDATKVDPALLQAAQAQQQNPSAQAAGAVSPELANNLNIHSGGMVSQDSQPEARIGEAAAQPVGGAIR